MSVSFLFHLYQPSFQDKDVFVKVFDQCYGPLLRLIKNNKDFNVTINCPLSILELMDRFEYFGWLTELKALVDSGKVEIVGSGAYHPLLTKLPQEHVELQVLLNEYALGYYFGRRSGFEGERAILIKDLFGFFPPELSIDTTLLKTLSEFSYKWVVADETAIQNEHRGSLLYEISDIDTLVVVRDRKLSNKIAFKRDADISDVKFENKDTLIVLDGETFGHHNKSGIRLLDNLYVQLKSQGVSFKTVSDLISDKDAKEIPSIIESTWGASDLDMLNNDAYPFWVNYTNDIQVKQWDILRSALSSLSEVGSTLLHDEYANAPLWVSSGFQGLSSEDEIVRLYDSLVCKISCSDQFWWSSSRVLPDESVLFNKKLIHKSLELYKGILSYIKDKEISDEIALSIKNLEKQINTL